MKKEAVLHIPLSQYAYAHREAQREEYRLTIRIRAAKGDIQACRVCYGDRVDLQEPIRMREAEMKKTASDDLFDYFELTFAPRFTRVCYYFLLDDGKEKLYYYSRGFCRVMDCHRTEYFQFPYIRREDILQIPSWAKEAVLYHIFPDSFATGKQRIDTAGKDGRPLGGTLRGISENLDYLERLGVTCIYLNPVFTAHSYHRYDTADYFSLDPSFGSREELAAFVSRCHALGIRVILDGVFNHCGPDFFAFRDVRLHGEASRYRDWFYQMPLPVHYCDPPEYEAFAYVREMPKLNTGNPEVVNYLCRVGVYWIEETDIDGWRLDVANEVNHDFWRSFRRAVRRVKPDCFLIAEIWEDAQPWLLGDQFDSSMNYPFSLLCRDFFAKRKLSAKEFDEQIQKLIMRYPKDVALAQMNFLDTHDVPRFLSDCDKDKRRLKLAFFYLFMSCGIPSVFYGDECYLEGNTEQEYRAAMDWDRVKRSETIDLSGWIALRRTHRALTHGSYETVYAGKDDGIYVFARTYEKERALVCLNNSEQKRELPRRCASFFGKFAGQEEKSPVFLEAMSGDVFFL